MKTILQEVNEVDRKIIQSKSIKYDPTEMSVYYHIPKDIWFFYKTQAIKDKEQGGSEIGAAGRIGYYIAGDFLTDFLGYTVEKGTDLIVNNKTISVKTRILTFPQDTVGIDHTINIHKFPMLISEEEIKDRKDIYICCGYYTKGREAYILGWTTHDKIIKYKTTKDLKYPAKCIPIRDLFAIKYLEEYINA